MRLVLVITGSRDLLPGEDTDLSDVLDVIRASHGVLVPLTRESADRPLAQSRLAHASQSLTPRRGCSE
jgi:hypothetical protein